MKNNYFLDDVIKPLILILPKMSGYVKTFKNKKNKIKFFHIDDDILLEKYKTIWTDINDFKNIELNLLFVYNDRYIKNKRGTYGHKFYTNFCDLNVPEDGVECEYFTIIPFDSLLVDENKHYPQV